MIRKILLAVFPIVLTASLTAKEPKELELARQEYAQALPHGAEAARLAYVNKLAQAIDGYLDEHFKTGDRKNDSALSAIEAEMKLHPAPPGADAKKLSKLVPGEWQSPRHDYLFRPNGTYSMLPLEKGATAGHWRIEGNQFIDTSDAEPGNPWRFTIILLNEKYFVYSDKDGVYFESRMGK